MLASILASCLLVAQTAPGRENDGRDLVDTPVVLRCDECGVRLSAIASTIDRLRNSRRDDDREDAARALRNVRWICHPEVVHALSGALVGDPDGGVRRESAESLTKLAACDTEATAALRSAAIGDRNPFVRSQAKKALRVIAERCAADCVACDAVVPDRPRGLAVRVPILGPARRFVPMTEVVGPGVHIVVNPRPPVILERRPIVSRPIPPDEDPDPLPPAIPTPSLIPTPEPARPIPPPLPPEARSGIPTERRTSAKPVIPPTDLPPLEGPRRD